MYRVLIVDDEKVGRSGISFLLRQMNEEFEITECSNGKQALEKIAHEPFHFLLTDIKMPIMDGLTLIQEVRKISPAMKCVILSGYSDFEYAKKAISMSVDEYLLKPVDPLEFREVMSRLIASYEKEAQETEARLRTSMMAREYILFSLLNNRASLIPEGETALLPEYKRVILIDFEETFFNENRDFEEFLRKYIYIPFDYLNLDMSQSLLLFDQDNMQELLSISQTLLTKIEKIYQQKAYIAVSPLIHNLTELSDIYSQLEDEVMDKYRYPDNRLLIPEAVPSREVMQNMENDLKQMETDLSRKNIPQFRQHLNEFYSNPTIMQRDLSEYSKYLFSLIIRSMQKELESEDIQILPTISAFYRATNTRDMRNILDGLCVLLEKKYSKNQPKQHKEIDAVKKYIYENYAQDISVDQLADYVCLAPSYLSHIFKKETGENLGKFIRRVRMEKAKDMLANTYEKIITISVAVGYQNVSYFCQSFREYYGVSPQKYRTQGEVL